MELLDYMVLGSCGLGTRHFLTESDLNTAFFVPASEAARVNLAEGSAPKRCLELGKSLAL